MYNMDDFLKVVKQTAINAVNASKPTNVVFGKVISVSPLKIKVDQKLILSSTHLILTRNVTNNVLQYGEEVILIQVSGGQKYVVIDRIGKG